jgi:hypothetical protein
LNTWYSSFLFSINISFSISRILPSLILHTFIMCSLKNYTVNTIDDNSLYIPIFWLLW